MEKSNIFDKIPSDLTDEAFEQIGGNAKILIERIVSKAHVTPEGQWYDQDRSEWVMVLQGEAKLQFEQGELVHLQAGEHLDIPAHCKHRVAWTSTETETLWLAVHY
ncbi:cupin domain-containing protein [Shewanella psychrophila]|uniref:Cupin domain-containing protein n=1 Tax=Shewanella psychrophila TaxID=225848 RepID=A0A1S6HQM8_9GAMM|nr:cupin domain-containing protein [Shewanella psychrophila]AQS37830.1 cupin domain-containing protein [Shewanella psychrophila]